MKKTLILLAGCLLGASAFASCYVVMDVKGNTVSESPNPPVDMSRWLSDTVPNKYGQGATMVFGIADADCGQPVDTWDNDGTGKKTATATKGKRSKRAAHAPRARHKPQAKRKPRARHQPQ